MQPRGRGSATASNALRVLELLDDERPAISAADVIDELQTSRATAYRYLRALVDAGLLQPLADNRFGVGFRVLRLARLVTVGDRLVEVARPIMSSLASSVGETVLLTRLVGKQVICVDRRQAAGESLVRISYEPGQTLPANAGASAYALIAWLPPVILDGVLDEAGLYRFTVATLTERPGILRRLQRVRAQGYAVSRGEVDAEVLGIAAPVRDGHEDVVAAIGIAAVSSRVPDTSVQQIAKQVCQSAEDVGIALQI